MANSSDLILAYFEKEIKREHIIDPYSIQLKLITVFIYMIEVTCALVMFSFVVYERSGFAGAYRSIINQLLAYFYGGVSSVLCKLFSTEKSQFENLGEKILKFPQSNSSL
jgi:hypothetical protein